MALRHAFVDLTPLRSSQDFRRLWIGRAFSGVGSQMTVVAVLFQVWQLTRSTLWTGAVGLAQALPLIAFGLAAGSIVDTRDRRRVYLVATTGQAACSVLLAVQSMVGHLPAIAVLALVAVQGCFVAVSGPAARTFIPRLLPPAELAAGLALSRITIQAAVLAGPALGGLAIGWVGVRGCYLVDAASFAAAFIGAFGLPAMRADGEPARPGLHGILDGLSFLSRSRVVRGALLTDLSTTVLSFPISLFPLVNAERFHDSPRTLGLFLTAIGLGGVLASALSGTFTRRATPGRSMLAGSAGWGAALALFAVVPNPWAGLALLVLAGAADTVAVVSRSTIVQLYAPDELRGRVTAAELIVGQGGPNIGNLRAGLLAGATSGTISLLTGGLFCLAAVAWIAASTPSLRRPAQAIAATVTSSAR